MRPGPKQAVKLVLERMDSIAPPRPVVALLTDLIFDEGWTETNALAAERAEAWLQDVLDALSDYEQALGRHGRFCPFAFNSSSPDHVQGCAFAEPSDDDATKRAKRRRGKTARYAELLRQLRPRDFESLCAGVLRALGVESPVQTPYIKDHGIDFYGLLSLEAHVLTADKFPTIQRQLRMWLVGQAKHYPESNVGTEELRHLVGAVELAKASAYDAKPYADLAIRVCDPVSYLLFTTGLFSADCWRVIDASGVVGMDGMMLAAFLADRDIGVDARGRLSEAAFNIWLRA
jgi:hypothetical protein